jgi:hypothetical protein
MIWSFWRTRRGKESLRGYHAGFAGAALAIKNWAWQLQHADGTPLPGVDEFTEGRGYYENEEQLIEQAKGDVEAGAKVVGKKPRVLVIGALGRCGRWVLLSPFLSSTNADSSVSKGAQ